VKARTFATRWIREHPISWLGIRLRQWPWLLIDTGDYLPVTANQLTFRQALAQRQVSTMALKAAFVGGNVLLIIFAAYGGWSLRERVQ
jgi:hypothetical protein